jgi:hypothetical protein
MNCLFAIVFSLYLDSPGFGSFGPVVPGRGPWTTVAIAWTQSIIGLGPREDIRAFAARPRIAVG